ncbi:MAG TPA: hypothetical protein PLW81_10305 [Thiobacillaceae bacterium]|nr:hypothetical protein [Thiobacillaceae bacterium]
MKLSRLLLLAAALLVVQWAGLSHGLSHGFEDHGGHEGEPQAACEWCLAYAALDHGLAAPAPTVPLADQPRAFVPEVQRAPCAPRPGYRSRAPPSYLA